MKKKALVFGCALACGLLCSLPSLHADSLRSETPFTIVVPNVITGSGDATAYFDRNTGKYVDYGPILNKTLSFTRPNNHQMLHIRADALGDYASEQIIGLFKAGLDMSLSGKTRVIVYSPGMAK